MLQNPLSLVPLLLVILLPLSAVFGSDQTHSGVLRRDRGSNRKGPSNVDGSCSGPTDEHWAVVISGPGNDADDIKCYQSGDTMHFSWKVVVGDDTLLGPSQADMSHNPSSPRMLVQLGQNNGPAVFDCTEICAGTAIQTESKGSFKVPASIKAAGKAWPKDEHQFSIQVVDIHDHNRVLSFNGFADGWVIAEDCVAWSKSNEGFNAITRKPYRISHGK